MKLPADHDDTVGDAIGLHKFEDANTNECTPYGNSFSWDNSETLAQKGSLAAPIMASMALVLLLIEISFCSIRCMRSFLSIFLLLAIFCQGLSFSFFNSSQFWYVLASLEIQTMLQHSHSSTKRLLLSSCVRSGARIMEEILHQSPCSPGQGSAYSIAALLIFFLCNILQACTPKPSHNKRGKEAQPSKSPRPSDAESSSSTDEEEPVFT